MKRCLPSATKVSKDAKETVQECTSEFISFITSEAAERVSNDNRKTLNGEDILAALTSLGFEPYAEVLQIYLSKHRTLQASTGKRAQKKRLANAEASGSNPEKRTKLDGTEIATDNIASVIGDGEQGGDYGSEGDDFEDDSEFDEE